MQPRTGGEKAAKPRFIRFLSVSVGSGSEKKIPIQNAVARGQLKVVLVGTHSLSLFGNLEWLNVSQWSEASYEEIVP